MLLDLVNSAEDEEDGGQIQLVAAQRDGALRPAAGDRAVRVTHPPRAQAAQEFDPPPRVHLPRPQLVVPGGSGAAGESIQACANNGGRNQRWRLLPVP
jgi:hypothetical protein